MQPAARRNEVLAWVRGGLRDFSISRAAVEWGIRIPRDTSQTVYVWCGLRPVPRQLGVQPCHQSYNTCRRAVVNLFDHRAGRYAMPLGIALLFWMAHRAWRWSLTTCTQV